MPRGHLTTFVRHPAEALAATIFYWLLRLLPIDWASGLVGALARSIGPKLSVSNRARRNIQRALPELNARERETVVRDMWDNLGRVVGEYPHIGKLHARGTGNRLEIIGADFIDQLRDDDKPGIFMMAHLGNWEFSGLASSQRGLAVDRVYRQANNRLTEWLLSQGRASIEGALIPKGPAGAKQILSSLKIGNHLALLVDQKMNDGVAVPFFGTDAMTAPALAQLALRLKCPVVPVRVKRLQGAKFQVIVFPPIEFTPTGNRQADVLAYMTKINKIIEGWIRDTPGQWLWIHNRWSK
ncbi:MAG: lauroyl acyltransferase [Magnetovibrio sp.]|nr:lauroyl acyltransferase [Magnetovibrio sp.]|tara:strand:- start:92 stop:982 length:891 start_codon:yes stop_codon:yes gene_type:complete